MVQELHEDNLVSLIKLNKKVMVQYSAGWCGNCRIMKPKFKQLAKENPEIVFIVADAEKFPKSRKIATVNILPTFAFFENGVFKSQSQTNKFEVFKKFIKTV